MYTQHTHTHTSMLFQHITVCPLFQSVHLMSQSVTSFPLCNFILSIAHPSAKNSTAMVVNRTASSTMLMKSIKRLLELASLCAVSECILFTLLSYFIILRGSRLSPDHT